MLRTMLRIILLALLIIVASDQSLSQNDLAQNHTSKVIIDKKEDVIITSFKPLQLAEGYELEINSVFEDEKRISVELMQGSDSVDKKIVSLSSDSKSDAGVYRYQKSMEYNGNITVIEVHFKNATRAVDWDQAAVDRIWQISAPQVPPPALEEQEIDATVINPAIPASTNLTALERFNEGLSLDDQGKYQEAILAYSKALEQNPHMIGAWIDKGLDLERLGRHDEAIKSYDAALQINTKHEGAWYSKGVSLLNLGKNSDALTAFSNAIELNSNDFNAWYGKGMALAGLGRNDEAVDAYREVVKRDSGNVNAWNSMGDDLIDLGRYEEAISALDQVTKLDPQNMKGWHNKGAAYNDLGDYRNALLCF